jgi:hypothetical protein
MTDQRLAALSRTLRAEGYLDNDPDAVLAAMQLIALADALAAQQAAPGAPKPAEVQLPT